MRCLVGFVVVLVLGVMVFGAVSWNLLPLDLLPDIGYPTLTVRTEVPGAAPEEVERNVTRPIEQALGVVSGLVEMSSVSRAGLSDVVLEFAWGTEMSDAVQDTLEKLDLVQLPGIGVKRAQAIVALRNRLGRFLRVEDLLRVRGLGPRLLRRLRPHVTIDPPDPPGPTNR